MKELLQIFALSGAASAILFIWNFLNKFEGFKGSEVAKGKEAWESPWNTLGAWLLLALILTFGLWSFSR